MERTASGPRVLALALVLAVTVGGCGEEASPTEPAATTSSSSTRALVHASDRARMPALLTDCGPEEPGWHRLAVGAGSTRLDAAVLGSGPAGVVSANDSNNEACDWLSFARQLARRGAEVAVFQYASVGDPSEVRAVASSLRRRGAGRVVMVGASVGGRAVIELAATGSPGVNAVVSLSAERTIPPSPAFRGAPDILPEARRVRLPSLYAGSRQDGYTMFGKQTRQLHDATPAKVNELLLVPGNAHGVDLLAGKPATTVRPEVSSFISKFTRGG